MSAANSIKSATLIHKIKAGALPDRYARGWHCLGLAEDYKDGKPHTLNIFGTKLVAFQGESGEISIIDGYCPHMGADLGLGEVKGNSVVCPFHHWEWGGDGVCKAIPYAKRIPVKARIQAWPVMEQNKLLFVWNDPEGSMPTPEVTIPRLEACFSDEWSDWAMVKWDINNNCRELVDNLADMAHFGPVHGTPVLYFCNVFDGHVGYQMYRGTSERHAEDASFGVDDAYFGPAYHITLMTGQMQGHTVYSLLLNCHVPIDQNSFELRFAVKVKRVPELSDEENRALAAAYSEMVQGSFDQDVAIWHTKTRVSNPLLCDGDGPIYQLREWYQQFYTDVADLPESKKTIFEYKAEEGAWHQRDEVPAEAVSQLWDI